MIATTEMTPKIHFSFSMPFRVERQFAADDHVSEPLAYGIVQIEVRFQEEVARSYAPVSSPSRPSC